MYMSIFLKKWKCSQTMKEIAKEAFENNMHHHDTMKTIAKDYLSNLGGSLPYFARIEAKEKLCGCVFS